jgi:type VI secretion system protein ImpE
MTASELFQAGNLQAAIDAQIQKVKAKPADQAARLFLFELLLFSGDLDRARKQLDVLSYDKPEATAAVDSYRNALASEQARRDVLAGKARPKSPKELPPHADLRMQALAAGNPADAAALIDQANAEAPVVRGTLNGRSVEGLRDADELFGTILEVFAGGNYLWIPLEQVESVAMNPPASPRDILLRPAQLVVREGPTADVLLPGLYSGSHAHPDEAIRLGRVTDWVGDEGSPARGQGGKLFTAGEQWVRFVDWATFSADSQS